MMTAVLIVLISLAFWMALLAWRDHKNRKCGHRICFGVKWSYDWVKCDLPYGHKGNHKDTEYGYWWKEGDTHIRRGGCEEFAPPGMAYWRKPPYPS